MEPASSWQLFNTSWTLHRLSPLHHGKDCETLLDNPAALTTYATRLREQLTGNVLAGLHVAASAADDDALSKTGALQECHWQSFSTDSSPDSEARAGIVFPGILITLVYENISYKAALLAESLSSAQNGKGSTLLPLLLTKLPTALRQTFITFLSANFDTYCSNLRLPPSLLCKGLVIFVDELRGTRGSRGRSVADHMVEEVMKELQLTLAFSSSIAPSLRTLNIGIPRTSLTDFLQDEPGNPKGRSLKQKLRSPLVSNLTAYLETHLAMKLDLDGLSQNEVAKQHVRLSKVACASFVLGSEGRMKLVVDARLAEGDEGQDSPIFRAGEALLQTVIGKAVIGDQERT
ncbi:CENP-A-nucleosome distal centromere subunit CENP-L [Penicillium macrosclerotiorum]|uniref:CENP-A-nucleosome distal centromere subunit CENP-L n=1 Tax=Penicillium macrosclerotiorum TaxID=303699 RepID=UPI0025466C3C|nr:CENP-A-nucleosome distal centromere subunit CENP-L [Penicillium macrosclerotiorum]KAJ5692935.1 CENP-A-nucleosome distal centromere subunit CENP-L [Penicillium macrosclerotiorum]